MVDYKAVKVIVTHLSHSTMHVFGNVSETMKQCSATLMLLDRTRILSAFVLKPC